VQGRRRRREIEKEEEKLMRRRKGGGGAGEEEREIERWNSGKKRIEMEVKDDEGNGIGEEREGEGEEKLWVSMEASIIKSNHSTLLV
jgi:hypothetical protein